MAGRALVEECVIENNLGGPGQFGGAGGAQIVDGAALLGCLIRGNRGGDGLVSGPQYANTGPGGVDIFGGDVLNCAIASNVSGNLGVGGLRIRTGSTAAIRRVLNCTIYGNVQAPQHFGGITGGIEVNAGILAAPATAVVVANCIVRANAGTQITLVNATGNVFRHCDIQGGYPGTGNIDADPLFVDPTASDFHLLPQSPCIDAGDAGIAGLPPIDADGDPRIFHGAPDIGADETILSLRLGQPGGPGTPVLVTNGNLEPGHEYYNVFSAEPCPGFPGSGPYLGLCASETSLLVFQFQLPLGTAPFHVLAPAAVAQWGPYAVPPATIEGVCFDWTNGMLGPVSHVVRFTIE